MAKRRAIRIDIALGDVLVSGVRYDMPESGDIDSFVCQHCLVETHKTVIAEIIQFGMIEDQHYIAVKCDKCGSHWTTSFTLEHWEYGVIDVSADTRK